MKKVIFGGTLSFGRTLKIVFSVVSILGLVNYPMYKFKVVYICVRVI
jgi:hypothetical protein